MRQRHHCIRVACKIARAWQVLACWHVRYSGSLPLQPHVKSLLILMVTADTAAVVLNGTVVAGFELQTRQTLG